MKGAGLFFLRAIDPTRISRCQKKRPTVKARRGINFATQLVVLAPLVAGDYAVLNVNDAMRVLGDIAFVRDQDDGVAFGLQAVKQGHDLETGLRVETVAAAMNPAMSSWLALRHRAAFEAGRRVLVLGATGNAGRMAVQVARLLGASEVVAVGRDIERSRASLVTLGASAAVDLADRDALGAAAAEVDVVLDYLWGAPTAGAMTTIVTDRADRGRPLTWVQIGAVAGATAEIPSAALRSSKLQIVGSGQGSVGVREILGELDILAQEITAGTITSTPASSPSPRSKKPGPPPTSSTASSSSHNRPSRCHPSDALVTPRFQIVRQFLPS